MNPEHGQPEPRMLAESVSELQPDGAGGPAEIARRLALHRTEDQLLATLAELFSGGRVADNHARGPWWVT